MRICKQLRLLIATTGLAVGSLVLAAGSPSMAQSPPGVDKKPPTPPPAISPSGKDGGGAGQDAKSKQQQLGKIIPETPAARAKLLADLYAHLATATDQDTAKPFMDAIERLWLAPGSDTVLVLMDRAAAAAGHKQVDLALTLLTKVVGLAPDFTEAWNRRAYVFYSEGDYERALGDLRRVLALDPSHVKALDGTGQILRELGFKAQALKAYERLLMVHPFWPGAQAAIDELKRDVEGRGL